MKAIQLVIASIAVPLLLGLVGHTARGQYLQEGDGFYGGDSAYSYGSSVSISGDGTTSVVGVPGVKGGGGAWIYNRVLGVWSQGTRLLGTGNVGGASQGRAVCISRDGNTVIVGGSDDNDHTGAVWIFVRSGDTWVQQGGKLVGSGIVGWAYMGNAVALSGDGNTAIVGGYKDDGNLGAAWIFERSGDVWSQVGEKLVGSDGVGGQFLGCSVAISDDGKTAIAGAWNYNPPYMSGAAWVWVRSESGWLQQGEKLVGPGAVGTAGFGSSVALSSDGNTAVVGGAWDNSLLGAAWVFTRSEGVWTQQGEKLAGTGGEYDPHQGSSVSLSADGNIAVVGGYRDNGDVGATWVFVRSSGVWTQLGEKLVGRGAYNNAFQGTSVDISADGNTIIAGGFNWDSGGRGSVWMFHQKTYGNLEITVFEADGTGKPVASARAVLFGDSLAQLAEAGADTNSTIVFNNLPEAYDYSYKVFVQSGTPWGDTYYGQKNDVAIDGAWTVYDTFTHNTPRIDSIEIFIDSTNQRLSIAGENTIVPGTRLRIEARLKNPSLNGAMSVNALGRLLIDRDMAEPYDIGLETRLYGLDPGEEMTCKLYLVPTEEGEYVLSSGVIGSSSGYQQCVTDAHAWTGTAFHVKKKTAPPPWHCANTGTSHSIVVPLAITSAIDGSPLNEGDYVGVFYDSAGTVACGGLQCWTGAGNIVVSAFGNDSTVSAPDGFAAGEVFKWKVYRSVDGTTFDAQATYEPVGGIISNTHRYVENGISQLRSLVVTRATHQLSIRQGWSLLAAFVTPDLSSLDTIFRDVLNDLIILKDGTQNVYMPSMSVNTVGPWTATEGYQVKMVNGRTVGLSGLKIVPENLLVRLQPGWSILPYVRDRDTSTAAVVGSGAEDMIIMKDQDGRVYVPSLGIDAIGTLRTGQAYQVKMKNMRTIEYPANADGMTRAGGSLAIRAVSKDTLKPAWSYANTGRNHTIIIPKTVKTEFDGAQLAMGDVVGVFFDSCGTLACAGSAPWSGTNSTAIAAFGDDPTKGNKDGFAEGEELHWKIWRQNDGHIFEAYATYSAPAGPGGLVTDTGAYATNGVSMILSFLGSTSGITTGGTPTECALMQNYPNPFNPTTNIRYQVSDLRYLKLAVYDILGREVARLVDEEKAPGTYQVAFDGARLASGVYICRMTAGNFVQCRKIVLSK